MNIQRKNSAHHFRMQSEREQTLVLSIFTTSQNFLQTFRIFFLQNGPYNINILVMFFELRAFIKFDQYGWFKKRKNLLYNL